MAMVKMELSAEEAKENQVCCGSDAEGGPKYPYGLELHLDDKSLGKLGMAAPPPVGSELLVTCKVIVTSASSRQTQGGDAESNSNWQIVEMEATAANPRDAAKVLFGDAADGARTS